MADKHFPYVGAFIFTILSLLLIIHAIIDWKNYSSATKLIVPMCIFISMWCAGAICISAKRHRQYNLVLLK